MTNAERQKRKRAKAKKLAGPTKWGRGNPPPPGYGPAKQQLRERGHRFEWARPEFGFEEGTFVDGAFLSTRKVIALAALSPAECKQGIADARRETKDFACDAVEGYMDAMRVTLDELTQHVAAQQRLHQRQQENALRRSMPAKVDELADTKALHPGNAPVPSSIA